MAARIEALYGTATRRRELRMKIRHALGTSRDDAPTAAQAIRAANELAGLMALATSGRFDVSLIDKHTGSFVNMNKALRIVRGEEG